MARETIGVGVDPGDQGDGDTLRAAFIKVNNMTADIYGQSGIGDSLRGSSPLTAAADVDVNFDTAAVFTMTSSIAVDLSLDFDTAAVFTITSSISIELNFTNASIGDVKDIIITDSGGTSSLTFDTGSNTVTTIAGTYSATAGAVNFIQVTCTAANTFFLSISQSI